MMLERQRFAKYSCKDIFRILLACETLVNNQLDLSHSCLLYRESNSWGERRPSKCSQNVYILQVICYVPASICVRQTDLLRFCCSRKVMSGCFRFEQCFPESSVSKPTAKFSDIECCCEDKKAGFVVGLHSGEESSEPVILF